MNMENMNVVKEWRWRSPVGGMLLGAIDGKICLCDWEARHDRASVDGRIRRMLKAEIEECLTDATAALAQELGEYFLGKRTEFGVSLLMAGTDFQRKVWAELRRIPYGSVATYADVARRIGQPRAVRAVAAAIGANQMSILLPCHRVIGSSGSLTGYAGGIEAKKALLRIENAF